MPTSSSAARPVAVLAAGALAATHVAAPAQAAPPTTGRPLAGPSSPTAGAQRPVRLRRLRPDRRLRVRARRHRRPARAQSAEIREALADNVDSWTTGVDFGAPTTSTPARSPRRSCWPRSAGRDPRAFGGVNLVKRLTGGSAPPRRPSAGSGQRRGRLRQHDRPGVRRAGPGRRRLRQGARGAPVPAQAAVRPRASSASTSRQGRRRTQPATPAPRQQRPRHRRHRARRDSACSRVCRKHGSGRGPRSTTPSSGCERQAEDERQLRRRHRRPRPATPTAPGWPRGRSANDRRLQSGTRGRSMGRASCRSRAMSAGTPLAGEHGAIAYDRAAFVAAAADGIGGRRRATSGAGRPPRRHPGLQLPRGWRTAR